MRRLRWLVAQHGTRLALTAGLALLAGSAVVQWRWLLPLESAAQQARHPRPGTPAQMSPASDDESPRARLGRFYAQLPSQAGHVEQLERVHAIAQQLGLELIQAEYRRDAQPGRPLERYRMDVSLQAGYPSVRSFVGEVLRSVPAASLDRAQFERTSIGDAAVRVQLSFSFYRVAR